ncbi:MAG TPA: Ig-like domain-containing protein, partial [Patescibacteria group bacterium]|nr:Ig-like domain-containing protein [Patescibacteria group bacterium]
LKNAVIGLIIVLSAFAIVTFVLNEVGSRMGREGTGGGRSQVPSSGGFGAIGSCSVESVYPEPNQEDVARNTSIVVTFKEEVDPSTVIDSEGNIIPSSVEIYKSEDEANKITAVSASSTSDNKIFVFTPQEYLGSPSETIWYTVYLSNDIKKPNGEGIFDHCHNEFLKWSFEVSTELDLTPPQVKNIFPPPDNERDSYSVNTSLKAATGEIELNNNPDIYQEAEVISVNGPHSPEVEVNPNFSQEGDLSVTVKTDGITAVLENQSSGASLGSSQFNEKRVEFPGMLSLELSGNPQAGNQWTIEVQEVQQADTLTIGEKVYTFVDAAVSTNEIELGDNISETANNIATAVGGEDDDNNPNDSNKIIASASGGTISLQAEVKGEEGNRIILDTNDQDEDIDLTPVSGGQDENSSIVVNDKKDEYRNATIQINFTEAVNPISLSGQAADLSDYIRIVNADTEAGGQGSACSQDKDCKSFNCNQSSGQCISGNYLEGEFMISNKYRTVEFRSNNKCGVNSCGQDIYCLPSNANLKVEFIAAELADCGPQNCSNRSPYNSCINGVCVNDQGTASSSDDINYPLASGFNGVIDMALNSLDGDKDNNAEGKGGFFDQNQGGTPEVSSDILSFTGPEEEDSYTWSFWLNDEIKIGAPSIQNISPGNLSNFDNARTEDLTAPLQINFDTLMQSGSLKTGSVQISSQDGMVQHRGLNLWSYSGNPVGYWISKKNIEDEAPIDGYPNRTNVFIDHSIFNSAYTYRAQAGSGLLDIYQNCFKPSGAESGSCSGVTDAQPSCCNGDPTNNLDGEGNCQ